MISGISLTPDGQMTYPCVFPACLLAGIHFLGLKGESWIPEQVWEDI
ncbi:hypothetical protein [Shewanella sp.]|nr:hypothetical protein [Shewanella sp.]MCJ8304985.1 hypothetical protein [Shewanella sp.]